MVEALDVCGEFEGLSLLEAHQVELTSFGPAYEGVYMDGGIADLGLFEHVDTLGEAIDTLFPHDALSKYGADLLLGYEVCIKRSISTLIHWVVVHTLVLQRFQIVFWG